MEWETLNKGSVASPMSIARYWGNAQFNGLVCLPVGRLLGPPKMNLQWTTFISIEDL